MEKSKPNQPSQHTAMHVTAVEAGEQRSESGEVEDHVPPEAGSKNVAQGRQEVANSDGEQSLEREQHFYNWQEPCIKNDHTESAVCSRNDE